MVPLDVVVSVVRNHFGVVFDADSVELFPADTGWLRVTCRPDEHERIAGAWRDLCAYVLESVVLEVHEVPRKSVAAEKGAVMARAAAQAFVDGLGDHCRIAQRVRLESRFVVDQGTQRSVVAGFEGKANEQEGVLIPRVDDRRFGRLLQGILRRTHDGRVACHLDVQFAEPIDSAPRQLCDTNAADASAAALVSRASLRWSATSVKTVLGNGEAVVVGDALTTGALWCVRVLRPEPLIAVELPTVALLPVGDLVEPGRRSRGAPVLSGLPRDGEPVFYTVEGDAPPPLIDSEAMMNFFAGRLRLGVPESYVNYVPEMGSLVVPREARARALAEITQMAAEVAREFNVEVRYGCIPEGSSALPKAIPEGLVESLAGQVRGIAGLGTSFRCFAWEEHSYLRDYDVVTAPGVVILEPLVGQAIVGNQTSIGVMPMFGRHVRVDVRLLRTELDGPIEQTHLKDVGLIEKANVTWNGCDVSAPVELDEWTLLHTAPAHGSREQFVVYVRVQEIPR
ncbi:MAG: hypothetical protein IPK26_26200 [Planctomycetes bacterium]|nr:hypothetical protein [Planctomycetota bacterium]